MNIVRQKPVFLSQHTGMSPSNSPASLSPNKSKQHHSNSLPDRSTIQQTRDAPVHTSHKSDDSPPDSAEAAAVAAAAEAIQNANTELGEVNNLEFSDRPWPIDKIVDTVEFKALPSTIRTSLVHSADFSNGLTYIRQIGPKSFNDKTSAIDYVRAFAKNEGFTVTIQETDGVYKFSCDLNTVFTQSRKRPYPDDEMAATDPISSQDSCPFDVSVEKPAELETWTVKVTVSDHNHGPNGTAASVKKRRYTYYQKILQDDYTLPEPPRQETPPFPAPGPQQTSNPTNLLKGLIGALRFDNAILEEQVDEAENVTHLFWTTKDCMEMLQQFPEVLFINFTQSSGMPTLVHIVGMTAFNTTFEVGYAFIKETGPADFRWVLHSLKNAARQSIETEYRPLAVITHRVPALINAVDSIFENTSQICLTQLMRDVNERSVSTFSDPEDQKAFLKRFKDVVDSETPDIYAYNEADFRHKYSGTKILEFVTCYWLAYKTKFVRAWVDQHMHFNNYSMGKAEVTQAALQKISDESGSDLLKLYYSISDMLKRMKTTHDELMMNETHRCPVKYFVPFYDGVRFKISTHALEMIKEQHEMYLEAMSFEEPLHRCTRMFTTTTGLPCKHTLSRPVTMDDLHPHWWLSRHKMTKRVLSESDLLSIKLTNKFEQTFALVREHFFNYSSLESREHMLTSMIKYFFKSGVSSIDPRALSGLSIPSVSPHGGSRVTPPSGIRSVSPVNGLGNGCVTLVPQHGAVRSPPSLEQLLPTTLRAGANKIVATKHSPKSPVDENEKYPVEVSESVERENGKKKSEVVHFSMLQTATRRCGKCNQPGHNARTCGQRLTFQGV